jgi:hypothetical protein
MATYTFRRGKFGRWGVSMWAGETQAFKLLRLLKKQKVTGVLYEEGPLVSYNTWDMGKDNKQEHLDPYRYREYCYLVEQIKDMREGTAPQWFTVSF